MGLKDEVEKISKLTLTTKILDNTKTLYTSSSNVRTTSREMLYKILLNKYESYGGKIIYNHELRAIDSDSSKVFFLNNSNFLVKHVIACDGIKSVSRNSISESASIPFIVGILHGEASLNQKIILSTFIFLKILISLVIP